VKKPEISIIGSGNVGSHLANALFYAGFTIHEIYSRSLSHAKSVAIAVQARPVNDLTQLDDQSDLYIFAIPDDAIKKLANSGLKFSCAVHTSGILPYDALRPVADQFGSFYPLQTFRKGEKVNFRDIYINVQAGNKSTLQLLKELALTLTDKVASLDDTQKSWLHLAAVFANNFSNQMLAIAYDLCSGHEIPWPMLEPLIRQTLDNAMKGNPDIYQTGPAVRGDLSTIQKHLAMLPGGKQQEIYRLLTDYIMQKRQNHKG